MTSVSIRYRLRAHLPRPSQANLGMGEEKDVEIAIAGRDGAPLEGIVERTHECNRRGTLACVPLSLKSGAPPERPARPLSPKTGAPPDGPVPSPFPEDWRPTRTAPTNAVPHSSRVRGSSSRRRGSSLRLFGSPLRRRSSSSGVARLSSVAFVSPAISGLYA